MAVLRLTQKARNLIRTLERPHITTKTPFLVSLFVCLFYFFIFYLLKIIGGAKESQMRDKGATT